MPAQQRGQQQPDLSTTRADSSRGHLRHRNGPDPRPRPAGRLIHQNHIPEADETDVSLENVVAEKTYQVHLAGSNNAMAESFFATLEMELIDRHRFKNKSDARMAIFHYIEGFYNVRRRHTSIGTISPLTFENEYYESTQNTKPLTVH